MGVIEQGGRLRGVNVKYLRPNSQQCNGLWVLTEFRFSVYKLQYNSFTKSIANVGVINYNPQFRQISREKNLHPFSVKGTRRASQGCPLCSLSELSERFDLLFNLIVRAKVLSLKFEIKQNSVNFKKKFILFK